MQCSQCGHDEEQVNTSGHAASMRLLLKVQYCKELPESVRCEYAARYVNRWNKVSIRKALLKLSTLDLAVNEYNLSYLYAL